MNSFQIADETFIAADPVAVGDAVADPANWRRWWPDLRLTVVEDRGEVGQRWTVTGALTGTMEIWLEKVRSVRTVSCCTTSCTPSRPASRHGNWRR